jgi:hypothetical protein
MAAVIDRNIEFALISQNRMQGSADRRAERSPSLSPRH